MKYGLFTFLAAAFLVFGVKPAVAGDEQGNAEPKQMVIALKTDEFELHETDLSHLGVGGAETIVTDSGKTIDLLRTQDGVEIYVDGELLELDFSHDQAMHDQHDVVHERIEISCDDEDNCDEHLWISDGEEIDMDALHSDGHHEKVIIIRKETESD